MKQIIKFKLMLFIVLSILFHAESYSKSSSTGQYTAPSKVIAIGDIHGAYSRFQQLLTELKLIDEQENWIGDDTYLVSLGDLLDRGAESRKVIDLVMKLQKQAVKSNGKVIQVMGNHELMVTTGDYSYVTKEEFSAFKDQESKQQRDALFHSFKAQNKELSTKMLLYQFNLKHPPGYSAYIKAFSSKGVYGKWLRKALPIVKVNDSLFVHGGLSSDLFQKNLKKINKIMDDVWEYQAIVEDFQEKGILPYTIDYWHRVDYLNAKITDHALKINIEPRWYKDFVKLHKLQSTFAFQQASPMWYRGSVYCHPYSESFNVERILKKLKAKRVVVGHTPLYNKITSRMNQQVYLVDTGMLEEVYHGNATALIIDKGKIKTYLLGEHDLLSVLVQKKKYSVGSTSMTDKELEDFLLTGNVIKSKKIGVGITNSSTLTLEKNGQIIKALYKTYDTSPRLEKIQNYPQKKGYVADRYHHEIAAYKLDRLIGLNLVPVAVKRTFDGRSGVVQYWVEGLQNEKKRAEKKEEFISECSQVEQFRTSYIFDVLIYNDDRNQSNLTFSKDLGMLYLIDHSIAFGVVRKKPSMYKKVDLRLSSVFREKLASITIEELTTELKGLLSKHQIKAIIGRRDFILQSALVP